MNNDEEKTTILNNQGSCQWTEIWTQTS